MEQKNRRLTVVLAGSVSTQSGYGSHSRDIARALIKSDRYDVKIIPIRWGTTPQDALDRTNPDDLIILDRITSPNLTEQPDIFIHVTIPNEFQRVGKYNIGITAGIETTLCRAEWISGCNNMDLVLATSEHSKKVFELSRYEKRDNETKQLLEVLSLNKPVEVLFEGVDTKVYNKQVNTDLQIVKRLNEIPEEFCFLFVGHWLQGSLGNDRKDVGMLIRVFLESFRRKTKQNMPALILKTSQAGFSVVEQEIIVNRINDIRNMVRQSEPGRPLPNIYLLHGNMTDEEMNSLYNHRKVKAMVSFTKGEGFGRPLLEFTTTGKPVIVSGWSGQMDFLHPEFSVLLPGSLAKVNESSVNDWILPDSQWFTVNYAVASNKMLDVHKRYAAYSEMSKKHSRYTIENFSFNKMMQKLCGYIDNIDKYVAAGAEVKKEPQVNKLSLPKLTKLTGNGEPTKTISLPKLTKVE